MAGAGELVKKPNFALKCVELLFGIISIAVVIDGYAVSATLPKIATIYGTQIGFIMISMIFIMSYLMDTPLHKNILLIVGGVGCVLWLTTGALIIDFYQSFNVGLFKLADRLVVSGVFALFNAVVYLVDVGLTLKS